MIAVTGANGLLGSFIVRKLIQEQKSFVAIKRAGSDTTLLQDVAEKIQWRTADVLNPAVLTEALEGCTHVIHSAAIVSFNPHRANEVMEINAVGTRNVVNVCLATKYQTFGTHQFSGRVGKTKGASINSRRQQMD